MDIAVVILIYFGAMAIPSVYCLATLCRGSLTSLKQAGLGLQVFWSLAVWGFVYYSWKEGYREYYWGWALLIPVNCVGLLYFCAVPIYHKFKEKKAEQVRPANLASLGG